MTDISKWATVRQKEILEAIEKHGSNRKAAKALNIASSTVDRAVESVKRKAAMQGVAPEADMTHEVPDPLVLKGTSTLYGPDGAIKLQWVKTQLDRGMAREAIEQFVAWLVQDAKGLSPIVKPPKFSDEDLLCVYPMGDPHFGMYAWAQETGDDFDIEIAERLTIGAIDRLVASAPPAHTCIIPELGDFFHADNKESKTPQSGHALDTDTRWAKVMQVGLRAMIHVIKRCLEKHQQVIVRIVAGNHDPHSSFALALALDAYFHNETRVKVDLHAAPFWYYRFGKCLIGVTHGDTIKPLQLPGIMAYDKAEDWGKTEHRYWYTGHVHHEAVKEYPGCIHETFRTLAARDAWHSGKGYRAGRDMRCLVLHREYGEIERHRCDIAMIDGGKK